MSFQVVSEGASLEVGEVVAIVEQYHMGYKSRSGTILNNSGSSLKIHVPYKSIGDESKDDALSDCQLPAMIRPRSQSGHYGCWKGAVIVKHGPDRLILQIEDNVFIPDQVELMFSPIGTEASSNSGRMYNDDGSVIGGSDVRSKRIRVRAVSNNVLASTVEGTILLVVDVTRTLYRTA